MKVRVSATEFQEKHARRLKAATPDITAGINKVTEAPGLKAAAKKDKMRTKLLAKIDDGTWERRVKGVTLEDWKTKARDIGVGRIAAGIDGAKTKVTTFAEQLLPAVERAATAVEALPDVTIEDSIARSSAFIREMAKFKKK